ncbi:MAG: BMC domain-containing protein [Candidatus Limnocylindrales bacterium]|jgi:microcompartment protein CcmL/EutN
MTTSLGIEPALALIELDSIAAGIAAGDAMAKRAPIDVLRAGTVHPGKYLVLIGGTVGDVEESLAAGREAGASAIVDVVFLPNAHPELIAAIGGSCREAAGEALGVIETATVAAIIEAADAGLKGARVRLVELRLADDLGGKAYLLFDGPVSEVEAAVEIGAGRIVGAPGLASRVIPQLHSEMAVNLAADGQFRERVRGAGTGTAAARARASAPAPRRKGR